jgi:O-antigen/teichoic acid export membrane protein
VLRNGEVSRSAAQLVRDFLALSGGELLAKLAGFAAFAYLARTLSAEGYGAVELAVALAMLFMLVIDFGFGPIGARELAREPARAAQLAAAIPTARSVLALLGVAGMLLCSFLLDQPRETRTLIRIYAVSLLAVPWTLNWLLQGLDLMPWVALAQAVRFA